MTDVSSIGAMANLGRVWAAVPFKGPVGAKRRLAGLLDADERARLSRTMLADVLGALLGTPAIERVLMLTPGSISPDDMPQDRLGIPDDPRVSTLAESPVDTEGGPHDGLNGALVQAQQAATAGGANRLLIVPADVPLLQPKDISALLDAASTAGVVIAPDRSAGGTNAMLLSPPVAIVPAFGEDSFQRHRLLAARAGRSCAVIERPRLALDLDTPADVAALLASDQESRTGRLLRALGAAARLERMALGQARSATI